MTLLDTSAVVAFLVADDALHLAADAAVREAARRGPLSVSTVTVAELLVGVRLLHHDERVVREFLSRITPVHHPVDDDVAERCAELRASTRALRVPDALILASADLHGDAVLTGDERWARVPGLRCRVDVLVAR